MDPNSIVPAASMALAIGGLTFVDGFVMLGLIINGGLAFGACLVAYQSGLPILVVMLASFIGVFLAEQISFLLAKYYENRIRKWQFELVRFIERRRATRVARLLLPNVNKDWLEAKLAWLSGLLDRRGVIVVVVGRWLPIASLVPASCAIYGLTYRNFFPASVVGCITWVVGWNVVVLAVAHGLLGRLL